MQIVVVRRDSSPGEGVEPAVWRPALPHLLDTPGDLQSIWVVLISDLLPVTYLTSSSLEISHLLQPEWGTLIHPDTVVLWFWFKLRSWCCYACLLIKKYFLPLSVSLWHKAGFHAGKEAVICVDVSMIILSISKISYPEWSTLPPHSPHSSPQSVS